MDSTSSTIRLGGIEVRFLLEEDDTSGAATLFEVDIPAGHMPPPPHSHDGFEELAYGLGGVMTFIINGEERVLGPGESLCIQRGEVHSFENRSGEDASVLFVATPGLLGASYFHDLAGVLAAAGGGPPDMDAFLGVMRRHGLTPVRPGAAV